MARGIGRLTAAVLAATLLLAPAAEGARSGGKPELRATIRVTEHGIPHILADSWRGLGYGYGLRLRAREHLHDRRLLRDRQRGERSRFFGPGGSWTFAGNGFTFNNLDCDFFFAKVIEERTIEKLLKLAAAAGPEAAGDRDRPRLRGRIQPLPAQDRGRPPSRPPLPRGGVGAADHV